MRSSSAALPRRGGCLGFSACKSSTTGPSTLALSTRATRCVRIGRWCTGVRAVDGLVKGGCTCGFGRSTFWLVGRDLRGRLFSTLAMLPPSDAAQRDVLLRAGSALLTDLALVATSPSLFRSFLAISDFWSLFCSSAVAKDPDPPGRNRDLLQRIGLRVCVTPFSRFTTVAADGRLDNVFRVIAPRGKDQRRLTRRQVMERALAKVGQSQYHVLFNNCEHRT